MHSHTPKIFPPGILFGLVPGFFEEVGWMGYAFPKMRSQGSTLSAALLLGVLWGLWQALSATASTGEDDVKCIILLLQGRVSNQEIEGRCL